MLLANIGDNVTGIVDLHLQLDFFRYSQISQGELCEEIFYWFPRYYNYFAN